MDLSIIIPLLNEEASLGELTDWIVRVCRKEALKFEMIFVDDGSQDKSWEVLTALSARYPELKALRFRRNYGKSAALNEGFAAATGRWSSPWMPICKTAPTRYRRSMP